LAVDIKMIKKYTDFREPKSSLTYSQKLATGPYPKPPQSYLHHNLFIKDPF